MNKQGLVISTLMTTLALAQPDDSKNLQTYMLANYHQFGQETNKSKPLFEQLKNEPFSPYMYKGYLPYLLSTQNYQEIIKNIPALDKLYAQDIEIQQIIAQALQKTGNRSLATQRMIALNKKFPENQEIAFEVVKLHIEQNEYPKALLTIDELLNTSPKKPNNFIFYFLKSQICLQQGNKLDALKQTRLCLELCPKFDKAWLLYATLKEQAGRLEEAVKGYTNFLETTSDNRDRNLEKHLLELVLKEQTKKLNKNDLAISQDNLKTIVSLLDNKNYVGAVQKFQSSLNNAVADPKKQLVMIQTLVEGKKINQATELLQNLLLEHPSQKIWYDVLHLLCQNELPYKKAIQMLELVGKKNPTELLVPLYLSDLLLRDQQEKKALLNLHAAAKLSDTKKLKAIVWHQIAYLNFKEKKMVEFKNALRNAQEQGVDFAPLNNLVAYYFMRIERDYDKARMSVERALKFEPANPQFLDTLAYTYYKEKNYKKAYETLQPIRQTTGKDDFVIQKHFAKITYQMGNTQQAIAILKKALPLAQSPHYKKQTTALIKRWSNQLT